MAEMQRLTLCSADPTMINHPPPIRNVRHDPGAQMRWSRAGARRCTRPSPVRSDRMWSLPISPAAAIIYESIHSGALNGTVGSCLHSCGGVGESQPVSARGYPELGTCICSSRRRRRGCRRGRQCEPLPPRPFAGLPSTDIVSGRLRAPRARVRARSRARTILKSRHRELAFHSGYGISFSTHCIWPFDCSVEITRRWSGQWPVLGRTK